MQKTILLFALITMAALNAQVGVGTATPNASALLDVYSTTAGFLMPRLSTAERNAITLPAAGLQVYDTNTNTIWFYNGTMWVNAALGAATATTVSNSVSGTSLTTTVNGVTGTAVTLPGATASNGLTAVASDIRLGGTLTAPTVVSQGTNSMMFYGPGTLYKSGGPLNIHSDSDLGNGLSIYAGNTGTYFRAIDTYSPNGNADIYFQSSYTDLASATTKMMIGANGNVGIGTTAPTGKLSFANDINFKKIVLYDSNGLTDQNRFYGFGISGGILRYHIDGTGSNHIFYAGTGASTANELMRIQGNGNVGIGTATPLSKLHVVAATGSSSGSITGENTTTGYGLHGIANANHGVYAVTSGNNIVAGALGYNLTGNGAGIMGIGNGQPFYYSVPQGSGGVFNALRYGTYSNAAITGSGGTDRAAYIGEYYNNNLPASVYVGARMGNNNYKILGTGGASVSTTMPTRTGERILFAPEAPENWFFDIGEATLINGRADVAMDPVFMDCIADSKPFKVFVQNSEGTLGTVRVTRNQNNKTFTLEDMGGASSGTVQYIIYAIWKTKENLRFPEFKAPFKALKKEISKK